MDTSAPSAGAALGPAPVPEQAPPPRGENSPPPQGLSPQPPVDGRDAPDPAVVHDGHRWALFSTQVGVHNVPVALSGDLREWSQPVDALPQLPAYHAWTAGAIGYKSGGAARSVRFASLTWDANQVAVARYAPTSS